MTLGIDPGSRATGWGLVTRQRGRYQHLASGVLSGHRSSTLQERLLLIHRGLREVIERYQPEVVAIESIFRHRSSESALRLGHARGVALLAAVEADLPIHEYSPTHIKKAAAGYGRADKQQVASVVCMLLGERIEGPSDVTDALAVAITHLAQVRSPQNRGRDLRKRAEQS